MRYFIRTCCSIQAPSQPFFLWRASLFLSTALSALVLLAFLLQLSSFPIVQRQRHSSLPKQLPLNQVDAPAASGAFRRTDTTMNKFNLPRRNIQKERRQKRTERRKQKSRTVREKASSGDGSSNPSTLALKVSSSSTHSPYMSGKNRAKLQKKWRRAQKEALQSGLVTLQDIEMLEDGEAGPGDSSMEPPSVAQSKATTTAATTTAATKKFFMKNGLKVRSKSAGRVIEPVVAVAVSSVDGDDVMMQ